MWRTFALASFSEAVCRKQTEENHSSTERAFQRKTFGVIYDQTIQNICFRRNCIWACNLSPYIPLHFQEIQQLEICIWNEVIALRLNRWQYSKILVNQTFQNHQRRRSCRPRYKPRLSGRVRFCYYYARHFLTILHGHRQTTETNFCGKSVFESPIFLFFSGRAHPG